MLIDCDAHISTPNCFDDLKNKHFIKKYVGHYKKTGKLRSVETQKKEAQLLKVDHQLVNFFGMNTGLNYHLRKKEAVDAMVVYNNSMSRLVEEGKGFFSATAWLSMQDIDASLKEIKEIKRKKLFGIFIDDTISWGRDDLVKPIFKECNDLDLPVYFHFTKYNHHINNQLTSIDDRDILKLLKNNKINFQCKMENNNHFLKMLYSLIESNWLIEMKDIKIIIAERGIDWIKPFVSFIKTKLNKNILPILQKNFWFTTEPEHKNFKKDADYIGWNRLLFASDHGHSFDCGGANFGNDLKTLKKLNLKKNEWDQITHLNFLKIKNKIKK